LASNFEEIAKHHKIQVQIQVVYLLQERGFSSVPLLALDRLHKLQYIGIAKGKGKAHVNKLAVYFKQ